MIIHLPLLMAWSLNQVTVKKQNRYLKKNLKIN